MQAMAASAGAARSDPDALPEAVGAQAAKLTYRVQVMASFAPKAP